MDYVREVYDYLHGPSSATSSGPRSRPPGQAPLDYFINQTHEGYCQHYAGAMALLLRMGGISARVATGFSPGGYSSRKKAWIVRDTDAHAWVEVWFDKYGWVTIDPTPDAHARPLAGRRAGARAGCRAAGAPPPTPARPTPRANTERPNLSLRPELQARHRRRPDRRRAGRGRRPLVLGLGAGRARGSASLVLGVLLFLRRPRGKTPMDRAINEVENALRARRAAGQRRHDDDPARAPARLALARGLGVPARAGRGPLRASPPPPPRAGRRALRRALAQGLGFGGALRALWALPPRLERGAAHRARGTFEVETSVRVRG